MESVSQSLAGLFGILELLPMSARELMTAKIELTTDDRLYHGGLPKIFYDKITLTLVYKNYVKTYLERDMRKIINVKHLSRFRRFMQSCAARIHFEFNASNVGNELGFYHHTIQ